MTIFKFSVIPFLAVTSICMISLFTEYTLGYHLENVATPFISEEKGISIDYPGPGNGGWRAEDKLDLLSFTSTEHSPFDQILESVDISIIPTQGAGVADFASFLSNDFYRGQPLISSFQVNQERDTRINNREAYLLVYSYFDNDLKTDLQAMDVIIKEGNFFYLLTFTAEADSYSLYLPIFTKMVQSFKIIAPPTTGGSDSLQG